MPDWLLVLGVLIAAQGWILLTALLHVSPTVGGLMVLGPLALLAVLDYRANN